MKDYNNKINVIKSIMPYGDNECIVEINTKNISKLEKLFSNSKKIMNKMVLYINQYNKYNKLLVKNRKKLKMLKRKWTKNYICICTDDHKYQKIRLDILKNILIIKIIEINILLIKNKFKLLMRLK